MLIVLYYDLLNELAEQLRIKCFQEIRPFFQRVDQVLGPGDGIIGRTEQQPFLLKL